MGIQLVEYHPRLDHGDAGFFIEGDDLIQVFGIVDDQGRAHGLAALRGAAAARQDGHA